MHFILKSRFCFLFLKLRIKGAFGMRLCFFGSFLFLKLRFCFISKDKFCFVVVVVVVIFFFESDILVYFQTEIRSYFKADDIVFISTFYFKTDVICFFVCTLRLRFWFISKLRICFIWKIAFFFSIEVGPHWPP